LDRSFDFQLNHDLTATNQEFESQIHSAFAASQAARIAKGLETATEAHLAQRRSDGGPYIVHPIRTALLAMRYDSLCTPELVIACLLHDTLEDTELTEKDVAQEFGPVVTEYVVGVTRYRPADETPQQRFESKSANWQRIMNSCREVRSIKAFDYCDNMITWKFIGADKPGYKKIPRWLREAQDLYLPLARITNPHAVRLLEQEIEGYLSAGHKMGDRLGP
jgi:(p)ppGpp synthase/HD superfamily hydrolase